MGLRSERGIGTGIGDSANTGAYGIHSTRLLSNHSGQQNESLTKSTLKIYEVLIIFGIIQVPKRVIMQSQKVHHYSSYSDSSAAQVPAEEQITKKPAGLWIDHRKAVIVTLTSADAGHDIKKIESHIESHSCPSAGWPAHSGQDYRSNADDHLERRFVCHLNRYYDEVISALNDAQSVLIFGPGEAKGELKKRIDSKGLKSRIVTVETADEMTEPQIAAKVRQYFLK